MRHQTRPQKTAIAQGVTRRSAQMVSSFATLIALVAVLLAAGGVAGCTPTVRLQVDPIQIYAKLDADVRVRLDKELQDLLVENPNLF